MAAVVLASYRTLLPFMSHDKGAVIEAIRAPAGAAASTAVDLLQRLALLLSWNKFEYAKNLLKNMEADYGKAFKIEHVVDDKCALNLPMGCPFLHAVAVNREKVGFSAALTRRV